MATLVCPNCGNEITKKKNASVSCISTIHWRSIFSSYPAFGVFHPLTVSTSTLLAFAICSIKTPCS